MPTTTKQNKCNCEGCSVVMSIGSSELVSHPQDESKWCEDCYLEHFVTCESCREEGFSRDECYIAFDEYVCYDCFSNRYIYCDNCSEVEHIDCSYYMEHEGENWCEHCYNDRDESCYMNVPTSEPSNSRKSDTFVYPIRSLVGLEIECIVPDAESMDTPRYWTNVSDGSISSNEGYGVEMVSSPSNGDSLMSTIDSLIDWRDMYQARVNSTCGFHVHFNSIDKTPKEIANIAIVYQKYQKILKSMMPPSRQSSNWCRDADMDADILRRVSDEQDLISEYYESMDSSPSDDKYNDARYCGINIHSRYYHGTIEFRLHSGTINKTKISNWISILNIIILRGIELSKFSDENFKSWMKSPPNINIFGDTLKDYICKRIAKFRQ